MSRFKSSVFDFGTVPLSKAVVDWKYEFIEECNDFHYVDTGCMCTTLTETDKKTFIKGILQLGLAGISSSPGIHEVSKTIGMFHDETLPEWIADDLGKRIRHPQKKFEYLTLRGFVEVT